MQPSCNYINFKTYTTCLPTLSYSKPQVIKTHNDGKNLKHTSSSVSTNLSAEVKELPFSNDCASAAKPFNLVDICRSFSVVAVLF